jgi:hypothetical protein
VESGGDSSRGVRGRLATLAKVFAGFDTLGLGHGTDVTSVLDDGAVVLLDLTIEDHEVVGEVLLPRGFLPGFVGPGVGLEGVLTPLVHHEYVTDDTFADGDRGGLLGVREGLEFITEGDEGVGGQTLAPET